MGKAGPKSQLHRLLICDLHSPHMSEKVPSPGNGNTDCGACYEAASV